MAVVTTAHFRANLYFLCPTLLSASLSGLGTVLAPMAGRAKVLSGGGC